MRVTYAQRHEYAARAIAARLSESALLLSCIREGLLSVIPRQCLRLLSWRELELRVCGRPTVDLSVLESHTVYSGGYTRSSPHIEWFWSILRDFSAQELASFLQFCWARSRLPADEAAAGQGSYRMQVNILDAAPRGSLAAQRQQQQTLADGSPAPDPNDMLLPTSETCFFNGQLSKPSLPVVTPFPLVLCCPFLLLIRVLCSPCCLLVLCLFSQHSEIQQPRNDAGKDQNGLALQHHHVVSAWANQRLS